MGRTLPTGALSPDPEPASYATLLRIQTDSKHFIMRSQISGVMAAGAARLFRQPRCNILGMLHCPALPGSPASSARVAEILDTVLGEAEIYRQAGVDGLVLENMHDTPYCRDQDLGPEVRPVCSVQTCHCTGDGLHDGGGRPGEGRHPAQSAGGGPGPRRGQQVHHRRPQLDCPDLHSSAGPRWRWPWLPGSSS